MRGSKKRYLKKFLKGYKKAPSHDTFRRVFGLIDPVRFSEAVSAFLVENLWAMKDILGIETAGYRLISVDGKEANGTGRKCGGEDGGGIPNLQTLNIYDVTNAVSLLSVPISEKTNEIPAAQKYLAEMQLKGCIITFDAMNTQKNTVKVITKNGGEYAGGLKGSHELFHEEVKLYFDKETLANIRKGKKNYYTYTEKAHNRLEKRTFYLSADIGWFEDRGLWAGLRAFICYDKTTEDLATGKKTSERWFYIASLTDVELCADAIRGHWGVESLHWHLDSNFSEDDNTTFAKNAFHNLSSLNKIALSLYKLMQPTHKGYSVRSLRQAFRLDCEKMFSDLLTLLDEDLLREAVEGSSKMKNYLK
ncbi:MAG: ISAs1 family transposase [Clostridiales bacterium]|nr:ISAs1 family transposase [Clostridiales bacterium]